MGFRSSNSFGFGSNLDTLGSLYRQWKETGASRKWFLTPGLDISLGCEDQLEEPLHSHGLHTETATTWGAGLRDPAPSVRNLQSYPFHKIIVLHPKTTKVFCYHSHCKMVSDVGYLKIWKMHLIFRANTLQAKRISFAPEPPLSLISSFSLMRGTDPHCQNSTAFRLLSGRDFSWTFFFSNFLNQTQDEYEH